jgi:hypothetical protein
MLRLLYLFVCKPQGLAKRREVNSAHTERGILSIGTLGTVGHDGYRHISMGVDGYR